jgi:hypothetical protein
VKNSNQSEWLDAILKNAEKKVNESPSWMRSDAYRAEIRKIDERQSAAEVLEKQTAPQSLVAAEDQEEGKATLTHIKGWTVLAFWDRSGDQRYGSNSAFLARGHLTFEEMIAKAKADVYNIGQRFTFEVKRPETDFAAALDRGIHALTEQVRQEIEQARFEIDTVLKDLCAQVFKASGVATRVATSHGGDNGSVVLVGDSGKESVLCWFEQGPRGYPVVIRYEHHIATCEDREGIELALEDMLEHPATGGKLRQLMKER